MDLPAGDHPGDRTAIVPGAMTRNTASRPARAPAPRTGDDPPCSRRPRLNGQGRYGTPSAARKAWRDGCRSSVVEHPLGKGEVVSSILTGSTTACASETRRLALRSAGASRPGPTESGNIAGSQASLRSRFLILHTARGGGNMETGTWLASQPRPSATRARAKSQRQSSASAQLPAPHPARRHHQHHREAHVPQARGDGGRSARTLGCSLPGARAQGCNCAHQPAGPQHAPRTHAGRHPVLARGPHMTGDRHHTDGRLR